MLVCVCVRVRVRTCVCVTQMKTEQINEENRKWCESTAVRGSVRRKGKSKGPDERRRQLRDQTQESGGTESQRRGKVLNFKNLK